MSRRPRVFRLSHKEQGLSAGGHRVHNQSTYCQAESRYLMYFVGKKALESPRIVSEAPP